MITWEVARHRVAIAGSATDAETGKALRGARVEITSAPASFDEWLALHAGQFGDWEGRPERPDRARTAADGHFHFLDLPPGDYTLSASLPGSGSRYGGATAELTLLPDSLGNAVLEAVDLALPPTTVKGSLAGPPDSLGEADAVVMAEVRLEGSGERTWSDGQGNFSLAGVEAGERTVVISARGFVDPAPRIIDLASAGAVVDLDLVLQPTIT